MTACTIYSAASALDTNEIGVYVFQISAGLTLA